MLFTFTIFPIGSGDDLVEPVARAVEKIAAQGLRHQVTGSATLVEGEWDAVMPVLEACFKELTDRHSRVYAQITVDHHEGSDDRIRGAVAAIQANTSATVRTSP
ncbi:MAG: thiamine-binding protein [Gemmatimonadetes bacterium]|nr:thiamine-binding protein [Gemmatimonadota bacterium]